MQINILKLVKPYTCFEMFDCHVNCDTVPNLQRVCFVVFSSTKMLSPGGSGGGPVGGALSRPAKDPNWLTLEVCREFARNKCSRAENECKFAHPPPNIEVQNGKVTCCFDSLQVCCML